METNKNHTMLPRSVTDSISRRLLIWLNKWPDKPLPVNFDFLDTDSPGMSLATIQGAYKLQPYIRGGYLGRYQFKIIYRVQPGNSNNNRLRADEVLDAFGEWAAKTRPYPDIGEGKTVMSIDINSPAAMFAPYEDGSEDHQILMTMDYSSVK